MTSRLKLILFGIAIAGFTALLCLVPPDGIERGSLVQFTGRFHPIVVHIPIALLLLVPCMEVLGSFRRWEYLRLAAGFVLEIATAGVLLATLLGWLLAWGGGSEGELLLTHFKGGIFLSITSLLCLGLRQRRVGVAYGLALLASVVLMGWTSHLGGSLTHGEDYLTKHMPTKMRGWIGVTEPVVIEARDSFYQSRVVPIFEKHCVTCHNPNKEKAGLRMDIYAGLMRGSKHGKVVEPGNPSHSELFLRITLPPDHEDFMPAEGKPPLTPEEVKIIELWILAGASFTMSDDAISGAPIIEDTVEALAPDYHPLLEQILAFNESGQARLEPRSEIPDEGLVLRTAGLESKCDDAVMTRLAPFAALIVDAELARTQITDVGVHAISRWSNLRMLDISHTAVGNAGAIALLKLQQLESLNLTGTRVDEETVTRLQELPHLKNFYSFGLKDPE